MELQVLRLMPYRREGEELGARANRGSPGNDNVAYELATIAEDDIRSDNAKWANADALAQAGAVLNDRGGVNLNHSAQSVTSIALTSASQTILPITLASPRNHHMFARWRI